MKDSEEPWPDLIPFVGANLIARWPQMVPGQCRQRWQTDRRSFTFDWELGDCEAIAVDIVLGNNAVVFEVLRGAIEVDDGLERVWARAGSAVAVSLPRFSVTPFPDSYGDMLVRAHIVGSLPFRSLLLASPAHSKLLERFKGTLPGIFLLAGLPLHERKLRTDPGEVMVVRYSQIPAFLRFLASTPKVIQRPERKPRVQ